MRPVLRVISGSFAARSARSQEGAQEGAQVEAQAGDAALARAVGRGERQAMAVLARRCLPGVHAVALRLLRDRGEAEDVAQETFLKVWRAIDRYDPARAKLESWAAKIAANACYDRLRKRGEALLDDAAPDPPDPCARVDDVMAAAASADRVRAAIAALPRRQSAAIELCALGGHTQIDAADILGVSTEALESLLSRARRSLKVMLTDEHGDLLDDFTRARGDAT